MRLLVDTIGQVRVFKDRSLFGLPRYVIEHFDPEFGFRYTKVLSALWYKKDDAIEIAHNINEGLEWYYTQKNNYKQHT